MGNQTSSPPRKEGAIADNAGGRIQALSAHERAALREIMQSQARAAMHEEMKRLGLAVPVGSREQQRVRPVSEMQGIVSGPKWQHFAKRTLSQPKQLVFHTVIFPKGVDPRHVRLDKCQIREEQRTRYPAGVIPDSDMNNGRMVEVYAHEDCVPIEGYRANHFLVLNK